VKWYRIVRVAEKVSTLRESATILRYTYIAYLVCFKNPVFRILVFEHLNNTV